MIVARMCRAARVAVYVARLFAGGVSTTTCMSYTMQSDLMLPDSLSLNSGRHDEAGGVPVCGLAHRAPSDPNNERKAKHMSMTTDTPITTVVSEDELVDSMRDAFTYMDPEDPCDEYGRPIIHNVATGLMAIAHGLNRIADAIDEANTMDANTAALNRIADALYANDTTT
jgi:hypothetical protein